MTKQVSLLVNDSPIPIDYFVQGFIDHTLSGMVSGLEGTPKTIKEIRKIDLAVDNHKVKVILNGEDIPINAFVNKLIGNSVTGMISSLKGIDSATKIDIHISK